MNMTLINTRNLVRILNDNYFDITTHINKDKNEVVIFLEEDTGFHLIELKIRIVGIDSYKDAVGIHSFPGDATDLDIDISRLVDDAIRDNFGVIYIHTEGVN